MFNSITKKKLRERFFVTPKAGVNFSGVLIAEDKVQAVYADVVAHPSEGTPQNAKGELYIRHDNVAYVQKLPPNADS